MKSRPSRARGLKHLRKCRKPITDKSRPSRARGLKPAPCHRRARHHRVAPFTGAWIETDFDPLFESYADKSRPSRARGLKPALPRGDRRDQRGSRPSRARGLKHHLRPRSGRPRRVAPFTGAWIETPARPPRAASRSSRPSRARGLKLHEPRVGCEEHRVAPFTGAWIETRSLSSARAPLRGRAHHGRVD